MSVQSSHRTVPLPPSSSTAGTLFTGETTISSAEAAAPPPAAVELDLLMGSTASRYPNVLHFLPTDANIIIMAVGAVVVMQDLSNPHEQTLLRGHDSEVCALAVCKNGRFIASGQLGSETQKGQVAAVKVWSVPDKADILTLPGICGKCMGLALSDDGKFLAAAGLNQMLIVWDVSSGGEQIYARRTEQLCSILALHLVSQANDGPHGQRPPRVVRAQQQHHQHQSKYVLCTAQESLVMKHTIEFDISQMSYVLTTHKMQMPGHSLLRNYTCGVIISGQLVTGTQQGELCVFSLDAMVFRASMPCCNGTVRSLALIGGSLYVAGGDGKIRSFEGSDVQWHVVAENAVDPAASGKGSGLLCLTPSPSGKELLATSSNGKLWRIKARSLEASLLQSSVTGEVTCVAFGKDDSNHLMSGSSFGRLVLWDLGQLNPVATAQVKSRVECLCAGPAATSEALGGTCPTGVVTVLVDVTSPHIVHSTAGDGQIVTFDLKAGKAQIKHLWKGGQVTGMTQRLDSENELITCHMDGRLMFWDIDYADPVAGLQASSPHALQRALSRLRCVTMSPDGRYVAAGAEDGETYIFDLKTSQQLPPTSSGKPNGHSGAVCSICWSPDSRQLATAAKDQSLGLWNFYEEPHHEGKTEGEDDDGTRSAAEGS
ncbi:hypothetical protein FOZ61_004567 [Perkinsus olseni]|uniref:Guanine nucleotide-binding protein subunit beta-like protein n=1 Tax=Perkinsus olseni TaxID=32597 RepID=A0A7J6MD04_PEROL|nr:hypothetical protein FOZ61_004567 [Perkinsus olseni]